MLSYPHTKDKGANQHAKMGCHTKQLAKQHLNLFILPFFIVRGDIPSLLFGRSEPSVLYSSASNPNTTNGTSSSNRKYSPTLRNLTPRQLNKGHLFNGHHGHSHIQLAIFMPTHSLFRER